MGNTNKRATPRSSQTGAQWDEASVLRLIQENKLAPKYGDNPSKSGKGSMECPICFLEFGILNTVNCCKQHICTDCLVQVKGIDAKGACPFCGNADLNASLLPLEKKASSAPTSSKTTTPAKAKDDRTSSVSEGDRSSGTSATALSYTTPEQEKKLRSYSLDDTTPASGVQSTMASKNDREALERQIREQRLQFDDRDFAEAAARSARSNPRANSAGASYLRYNTRTRYGAAPAGADGSSYSALFRPGGMSSRSADTAGDGATGLDRTSSANGNLRFVSSLEGLLQNHGNTRITSIEQLEEIMLMEAIRQSMQDVGEASAEATSSANSAQALPAPPARSSSSHSSSRASSRTSSPLPPIPPNSQMTSYHTSHHSSRHSPTRSSGTPADQTTGNPSRATTVQGGNEADSGESGESADEEEGEEDEEGDEGEGGEGEERGSSDFEGLGMGLYGSADDEEEEAQIRLAMELSLAEANHNTTSNTPTSQHGRTGLATAGLDAADGLADSPSERDSPHSTSSVVNAASALNHTTSTSTVHITSVRGDEVVRKPSSIDSDDEG